MAEPSQQAVRRATQFLLVLGAVVFVLLRAPLLSLPLERDEGEYAYVAWRMLEGDVPYRDAFDQKPPGVFAVYAGAVLLAGRSVEAIHGALLLWSAATAWLLYGLVRRLAGGLAGAFAVLLFAVLGVDPSLGATAANTELFLLLPMVGSTLALVRALEEDRALWWVLCGALVAAACWFKQVGASHALFAGCVACIAPSGRRRRPAAALGRLGLLALGGVVVALPVFAVFAAAGALAPFLDAVFLHNVEYAQQRSLSQAIDNLHWNLLRQGPGLGGIWLLVGLGLLRPSWAGRRAWGILAGWLAFSALGVAVGLQFRPHYFVQAVPAVAALAALPLAAVLRRALERGTGAGVAAAVALCLAVVGPPVWAQRSVYLAESPEAAARAIYGWNPFPESIEIARYIEHTSEPDESVFVLGSEPQILFYAGRRSATRYIFVYPLTGPFPDAEERQRQAMAEVEAAQPRYVVWVNVPTSLLVEPETDPWFFDAVSALVRRHYQVEMVLRVDARREDYEVLRGEEARHWLASGGAQEGGLPWVSVLRRVR